MNACCFFGHREVHDAIRPLLLQAIRTMIEQMHVIDFYVGDKGCFDSMAFSCVKELRKEYPYIRLQVVLAYMPGQKAELEKDYTDTIYPENMETVPRRFAIVARNHWMADRCAYAIVYVNGVGGAYSAAAYADRKGVKIYNLASATEQPAILFRNTFSLGSESDG